MPFHSNFSSHAALVHVLGRVTPRLEHECIAHAQKNFWLPGHTIGQSYMVPWRVAIERVGGDPMKDTCR